MKSIVVVGASLAGPARGRDAASRGLRRAARARRRRAAPAVRPAAALEGDARGGLGARPDRAAQGPVRGARSRAAARCRRHGARRRRADGHARRGHRARRSTASSSRPGSTPRTLPGQPELDGVFTLRTIDDCHAIRDRLDAGRARLRDRRGLHRRRGRGDVSQARAGRDGARGPAAADGARRRDGARARCSPGCTATTASTCAAGSTLESIEGTDRVEHVRLADGEQVDCDVLIVAVGVGPETRWLEGSGLVLDDGVRVRRDAAGGARRGRRRRRGPLAEPGVRRRGHAHRALDQRGRAGRLRRERVCSAATRDERRSRSRRSRSCGRTSTT